MTLFAQPDALALIQRWEASWLAETGAQDGWELERVGSFAALFSRDSDEIEDSIALPVEPVAGLADAVAALKLVEAAFRARGRVPCLEINAQVFPDLVRAAGMLGLRRNWSHPLMACRPADFRPRVAPGVAVHFLEASDPDEVLGRFWAIRRTGVGTPDGPSSTDEILRVRRAVEQARSRFALGYLGGEPAGTGFITPLDGVGEIVGIATLPEMRRRGVAATVTSALAQSLFEVGGTLAWLDAADDVAVALYARLGFFGVGDRLCFVGTK